MKKILIAFSLIIIPMFSFSQEIQSEVAIDYSQVQSSNIQVFSTLKQNLKDFINNTQWTDNSLKSFEKIKCTFSIIITEKTSSDEFKAKLTVQSSRPVYNSTYTTPIFNYQDNDFSFKYVEFEPLIFNERKFSGKNLIDVVCFYIYLILGEDADSFQLNSGTAYYQKAQNIADYSINQGYSGWNSFDGPKTRGSFISDLLKDKSNTLRKVYYQYNRLGMDNMSENPNEAKNRIFDALMQLQTYQGDLQYYPLDNFLNVKKDEILGIFSAGNPIRGNISNLRELLNSISPINTDSYWNKLK